MKLENITQSRSNQTQKATYWMILPGNVHLVTQTQIISRKMDNLLCHCDTRLKANKISAWLISWFTYN